MPTEPNWEDVRWDHLAANGLAGALRRAAADLDAGAADRRQAALRATADWQGEHRLRFDADLRRGLAEAAELAELCRGLAGQIDQLSRQAAAEQRARERDRADWERERREERARAAAEEAASVP